MPLQGRSVVVTGASGGIGTCLVAGLVEHGAHVVAVARQSHSLMVLKDKHGDALEAMTCDIADDADRTRLLVRLRSLQTPPSMLVLSHAMDGFGLFEQQSEASLRRLVDTNLTSSMLLLHAMLPLLRAQPQAAVVAIGSTFGSLAFPGFAAYSASKFGLRGLIEALAREYADDDALRFQYLSPRATRTRFNSPAAQALNRELSVHEDRPEEVARRLLAAIRRGDARLQVGWPEKLFVRLNGAFPWLVDGSLRGKLAAIRRHALPLDTRPDTENLDEPVSH
ncbi:short chain dehydrogenase [Pseudoxanthomonas kalamensis DSM 18571]|uniref:SDR family oxidoreductase n=1 Tax=Pseudoxanthomonas kalamensis TaxID=289483 RepID=UPI0013911130|nr:short chain dehydrogenase [Pseudoxanthomonas kalamensis DSM 18571]